MTDSYLVDPETYFSIEPLELEERIIQNSSYNVKLLENKISQEKNETPDIIKNLMINVNYGYNLKQLNDYYSMNASAKFRFGLFEFRPAIECSKFDQKFLFSVDLKHQEQQFQYPTYDLRDEQQQIVGKIQDLAEELSLIKCDIVISQEELTLMEGLREVTSYEDLIKNYEIVEKKVTVLNNVSYSKYSFSIKFLSILLEIYSLDEILSYFQI